MTRPPDNSQDDVVRLSLPKGCVLVLTWCEYKRGIARGKAMRRHEALERRINKHQHPSTGDTPCGR